MSEKKEENEMLELEVFTNSLNTLIDNGKERKKTS